MRGYPERFIMKQLSAERQLLSRLFFRLLPYQVLLLIINAANGIVDSLHASNFIGTAAMSALGLYSPLDHFFYAASIILVSGSQLLSGRFLARNEKEHVSGIFSVDLIASATLSILTTLVLLLVSLTDATRSFVADAVERQALHQYILGQSFSIPALILGQQLFAFLSLENQTRRTMIASLSCIVTNTVMDVLLVVVFKWGTFGLGLSSSIAVWVFFAVQAQYYLTGKSAFRFSPRLARMKETLTIVRLGYPGAISRFVEMFRCVIVNMLIMQCVGSIGLSAFAAVNSVMAVLWPIPFGILAVIRMLFGISIGEEDRRSLTDIMHIALTRGILICCGIAAALIILSGPITGMFYHDPASPVFQMTAAGFRILPICMPFSMIALIFAGYSQATEQKPLSIILPILDGAVFVVLFSLLLIPAIGLNGLYIANIGNGVFCTLFLVMYAAIALHRLPRSLNDLLLMPPDFGAAEEDRIDISVQQMSQVMAVSSQVTDFCLHRGIDPRRSNFAGLAMEEMAGNVVKHGFSQDRKPHSIDIRVVRKDNDVILRLRDNCPAFNPTERASLLNASDKVSNVGLRIVYSIAKDVQYQNLLGLNVLTIRI